MNIIDLAFEHAINIEFDGDFDGGNYYLKLTYLVSTNLGVTTAETIFTLKQTDIDLLYKGAKGLVKTLEKHIMEY